MLKPTHWRSLEHLRDPDTLRADCEGEFAPGALPSPAAVPRRSFLKILGATVAFASATGCDGGGSREMLPYVRKPDDVTPGVPTTYATSFVHDGTATGLLVKCREGRPIKVEGNPMHPASRGATGIFAQASILGLYDPHRAAGALRRGASASVDAFRQEFAPEGRRDRGHRLAILMEPTSSPLRLRLLEEVRARHPEVRVFFETSRFARTLVEAARQAFGRPLVPRYDFASADCVVSVGSDFAAAGPDHLRHARDFCSRRQLDSAKGSMNRLFQAESLPTPTGSLADHHLRARPSELPWLLAELHRSIAAERRLFEKSERATRPAAVAWLEHASAALRRSGERGLVVAGERLPEGAHRLAFAINQQLGNTGTTIGYAPSAVQVGDEASTLPALIDAIENEELDTLLVLGGNAAYSAPGDLRVAESFRRVAKTAYLGPYANETAECCQWTLAEKHYLESWGDARAYDGTYSLVQPLVEPLRESWSIDEVLHWLAHRRGADLHTRLRDLRSEEASEESDADWRAHLARGFIPETAFLLESLRIGPGALAGVRFEPPSMDEIEVSFEPDPCIGDGRFSANAWLQELPDPTTKQTWGNAALLSPATAQRLDVRDEDVVEVANGTNSIRIPALVVPGHADGSVTLRIGYGRRGEEEPGVGIGVDVGSLRRNGSPFYLREASLRKVSGERVPLATTQRHWTMEGRTIVLERTLDEFRRDPDFAARHRGEVDSLYAPLGGDSSHQWGMTVDLSVCTGCSACVVACQAENNVPVVGAEAVRNGREMHWLRIDRYFSGRPEDPQVVHQPMLCQHCEKAPCEYVCPVNATVHSSDGLNEMVYNRCVGTRFCSNNCPYKVRRFNWLDYNRGRSDSEALVLNPEVTVRARGVMEKCTYCVQRIRKTLIETKRAKSVLADGVIRTACQEACPTGAIVFGDLANSESHVAANYRNPRRFAVLHELGVQPRTQYLARISNPVRASAEDDEETG